MEFQAWPKIPRLNKPMIVTEKIDGTNGAIVIEKIEFLTAVDRERTVAVLDDPDSPHKHGRIIVGAQSRNRLVQPGAQDNAGFAGWVERNAADLVQLLGPGRHFGEWWGKGIQRGYDQETKRFSLFNVDRYAPMLGEGGAYFADETSLDVVPVLARGMFDTEVIDRAVIDLWHGGSRAARGYMRPEGVVAFHTASRQVYKAFCDPVDEAAPKGAQR